MIPICTETEEIIHPAELRADEYVGNNGLIYCSKCHTPRQKRIEVAGKVIEPRCMCACQTEDYVQREQERKHREFLDRVEKNRSVGLTDPVLRKHTFENDLGYNPKQMGMAKQFVRHWDEFKKALRDIGFKGTFSFETLPPDKLPESVFEEYCRMYANLAREMVRDL